MTDNKTPIDECPAELRVVIQEFWPQDEWDRAAQIALLESGWDAFALNDTATRAGGCGHYLETRNGVRITSERSVGYFQINACNFPAWEWQRFYNARHNAGTAHMLWESRGWNPWYFSATSLGIL
jgi:hypothetical protein